MQYRNHQPYPEPLHNSVFNEVRENNPVIRRPYKLSKRGHAFENPLPPPTTFPDITIVVDDADMPQVEQPQAEQLQAEQPQVEQPQPVPRPLFAHIYIYIFPLRYWPRLGDENLHRLGDHIAPSISPHLVCPCQLAGHPCSHRSRPRRTMDGKSTM